MAERTDATTRRCLVTRQVLPRERLLRFVVDPEGCVRPDPDARLPGRGMWLSAERNVVNKAVARNLFARAARAPARVEVDLAEQIERLLARRALDTLGLARRAGQVAVGFEQVRLSLRAGTAAVLVTATDAAADGRRKLRGLGPQLPLITAFTSTELGAALGRESLMHVAVAPGGLAQRLLRDVERLAGFRPEVWLPAEGSRALQPMESKDTTEPR
jgi:predicted RNA-binding protein YlxR (DUF448 family)/ribosomal protein L30E